MNLFLPFMALVSGLLLTFFLYHVMRRRAGLTQHIGKRLESLGQPAPELVLELLGEEKTYSDIPLLNRLIASVQYAGSLHSLVRQAGLRMRPGKVVLWTILLGMVAALIVFLRTGSLLMAGGACVGCGPVAGVWWLRRRRRQRRQTLLRQLPDTLEMLRGALQAGYSLPQALEAVCEEVPDPIRTEFRTVTEELRLGHAMRAAFQGLYDRSGLDDLRFFALAIMINRDVGGNLSEVIDAVSTTIRERFKLKAQISALTAQGRFSALILCALTPTLLGALSMLNPDYLQPLYHSAAGQTALVYAGVSTLVGYLTMRRIVNLKIVRLD
jgi:tight adherence protein B